MTEKKAALITGGAKRIGEAICLTLAQAGYDIIFTTHTSEKEAMLLDSKIRKMGRECAVKKCDLNDPVQTKRVIQSVLKDFPSLELIINNASIFEQIPFSDTHIEDLNKNFNIHFKSPFIIMREFQHSRKNGQIINILDTNVVKNKTTHTAYLLSKKTLAELTKAGAAALAPDIRVNAIAPGLILPPANQPDSYLDRLAKNIPLKRKGSVKNITDTIEFLIKNDYITGQIIFVDGGEHLI